MKITSTKTSGILASICSIFLSLSTTAQSGQGGVSGSGGAGCSFTGTPVLQNNVTPLSVGAKYKFTNVYNGTNAYVTIVSATGGASVTNLDDNTLTKPEAFSPVINVPANSNGLVEFKIEFINAGGNPKTLDILTATAMDIDGSSSFHEVDVIDMGIGSTAAYVNPTVEINMIPWGTGFKGTNTAGIEYTAVDTTAKQVMFTVTKPLVSTFTYKAGANNAASYAVARQKGIYFKGFDYTLRINVLPVKYLSFSAVASDTKTVTLNWLTANEINNDHFEAERSFNGKDFSNIGIALDGFESGSGKSYAFRDKSALLQDKSTAYYRLKQIDGDGRINYSNVISVRFKNENGIAMEVAPNPFTERLIVRFNSETTGNAEIRIADLTGKTVNVKKLTVSKGYNNLQAENLASLPSGMYVASVIMDGKLIGTQKIIK